VIVRHQRESAANKGFRQLARYIQGRDTKPRATWFHAANLPGVSGTDGLELACKLVDAVQAQNTRAGSRRTYHLVISLHPDDRRLEPKELRQVVERLVDTLGFSEHQYIAARHDDTDHEHIHVAVNKIHPATFRIHSPAWDHQKLFTVARALELELGLTPLRSRTRQREHENVPQRVADWEAHHGIDSFARWAREKVRPALRVAELRTWDDVHDVCGRYGVVIRLYGNGLVLEDVERGVRVKASFVARELSKARLCGRLGAFHPVSERQREAAHLAPHRYSPMPARAPQNLWKEYEHSLEQARKQRREAWRSYRNSASRAREQLRQKYRLQRGVIKALPGSPRDRSQLLRQLAFRKTMEARSLKRKLAIQRKAIERTWHPGTWRHFVATQAAERDVRAVRLIRGRERQRSREDLDRGR